MHHIGVKMQTIKKCIYQQIDNCLNMYLILFILNTRLGYSKILEPRKTSLFAYFIIPAFLSETLRNNITFFFKSRRDVVTKITTTINLNNNKKIYIL